MINDVENRVVFNLLSGEYLKMGVNQDNKQVKDNFEMNKFETKSCNRATQFVQL